MGQDTIGVKLDQLAEHYALRDLLGLQKKELIDQVFTPEIRAHIEEVETEFGAKAETVNFNIALLEEEIRATVLLSGESAKGQFFRASFKQGRTTWDTKRLEGYALSHPEIEVLKKVGEPSVSISKI